MANYKYILLDLDETLLDFHQSETVAFEGALSYFGIPCSPELRSFYEAYNLSLWKKLEKNEITKQELFFERFNAIVQKTGATCSPLDLNARYMSIMSQSGIFIPGAREFLDRLAGLPLYIITNGNKLTVDGRLRASGIDNYISDVFISDVICHAKPSPLFFDYVVNKINDPDRSSYLVIGDSLTSDIQGAINANMPCCLFSRDGNYPPGHQNYAINHYASDYETLFNIVTNKVI